MNRNTFGFFDMADDDDARMRKLEDFVNRVQTGDPAEGYSEEEAVRAYADTAKDLPDSEFERAAVEAFRSVTPDQRREFARVVNQTTGIAVDENTDDPEALAHLTSQLRSSSGGGLLGGLLGGGGGGMDMMDIIGSLIGGGGQQSQMAPSGSASQGAAGGIMELLKNPIVKMIIGLIAANAMKNMAGGRQGGASQGGGGLLDGIFGGMQEQPRQQQPVQEQPSQGGGGILDALFGGGDDRASNQPETAPRQDGGGFRPVENATREEQQSAGGILDALFGGGQEEEPKRETKRERKDDGKVDGPVIPKPRRKETM